MRGGTYYGGGPPGRGSREGFADVVRGVWLSPRAFFAGLDPGRSMVRPALLASLVLYLNLVFDELLRAVWRTGFNYGLLSAALPGLVVSLVLGPLLVAGLSALVLTVLDGTPSRRKFGPVFRSLGYASVIGAVLWVPFAPFLAVPYGLYVATVAVKETLDLNWARAAVATLAPLGAALLILVVLTGFDASYFASPPGE